MEDARTWQKQGQNRVLPGEPEVSAGDPPPSSDLVRLLDSHALSDPALKVYIDVAPLPELPEILLLLLLSVVNQVVLPPRTHVFRVSK